MQLQAIIEFLKKTASFTTKSRTLKVLFLYSRNSYHPCIISQYWNEKYTFCLQPGSIRVYCRVRPFLHGQSSHLSIIDGIEEGMITIRTPSKHGKGSRSFNFNKVFGSSATQGWLAFFRMLYDFNTISIISQLCILYHMFSSSFFFQGRFLQTHSH